MFTQPLHYIYTTFILFLHNFNTTFYTIFTQRLHYVYTMFTQFYTPYYQF